MNNQQFNNQQPHQPHQPQHQYVPQLIQEPQQAQQAPQAQTTYSNEGQMPQGHTQQPQVNSVDGLTKVEVVLDSESLQILKDANAQFGESIVNLGIKMMAETEIYKNYMMKAEVKKAALPVPQEQQNAQGNGTMSLSGTPQSVPAQTAQAPQTSAGGFQAW